MTLDIHIQRLGTARQVFIDNLHLSVAPGQILTLMGPSGSGKSSLLAAVAGTLAQDNEKAVMFDGSVSLDGQDISQRPTAQRGIGLLFQDALLFAHMTVAQNLLFAVPRGGRAARLAEVQKALDDAELPDFGERDPATLSGGQRARIALMRALLARPRALLLDEPFSRLDAALRSQYRSFVFAQIRQRQIPAILVTHDASDAADPAMVVTL
jgi:putative thiamine transport system ATP-binding protein